MFRSKYRVVPRAGSLEGLFDGLVSRGVGQERIAFMTTEGDEVERLRLLIPFQAVWHGGMITLNRKNGIGGETHSSRETKAR
jgi:hypothetical protein